MQRDDGFMDWVDTVREQMSTMADRAQAVQRLGEQNWDELQTQSRIAELLRELGEIVYANTVHGDSELREHQAQRVIDELVVLQADGGVIDLRDPIEVDAPPSRL